MLDIDMTSIRDKKILLVDDEVDILNLLEAVLLKEDFKNIYKATCGHEAIKITKEISPDIIVLDIMMPDIDGFEVCRRLREFTLVPIIFLSAMDEDVDKLLGLGIGGDDYITKPFSPKEVAYRIKAHFRRSEYMALKHQHNEKNIITFGNIEIDREKGEVKKRGIPVTLTAKEYNLLLYLVQNSNQILSKNKILTEVWGYDFDGYDNTLMVHIRHLRKKIEDDPANPRHIITAKGLGYKLIIEDE
ncbi:response regulator transcription factor [Schnuerera ultunensis]|uniref:Transcriptional regulatory protein YycF n=1 Tax=[Clostridium] ultunense Esp TaxID=1288971 RepID=A0A1M4PR55_9FIRM|nr:response regulator transcription factor [Schnuerera ultunensis]SHD77911.1 Transcriptional regulatory protein YycF [[Clostridium] ultunense Esp]